MNKKISVIVPVYNVEKYIGRCVESIINQTYKNLEIILVDDGSSDNSGIICDDYAKIDDRITVIHKENGGLSDARNKGIDKCTGDYISFIDSDDWIELNLYSRCIEIISKENPDIINFSIQYDYANGKYEKKNIKNEEILSSKEAIIYINSFKNLDVSACNKIYKKNLFENIRFPYKKLCEDCYVMYKIFDKANKVYIMPFVGYHYFKRDGSITNNKKINMDFLYAHKEQLDYFIKCHKDLIVIGESSYAFSNLTIFNIAISINCMDLNLFDELKKNTKKYGKSVYKNKYLSLKKKFQFFVYQYFNFCYKIIMKVKINIKNRR